MYKTFNTKVFDHTKENMFFGESVGVARFDTQRHNTFEKLTTKQIGFFWVPDEIDLSKDRRDFNKLSENEKQIFLYNLRYQILLDSVQGRSPAVCFLPIISLPELESWVETWTFSESIHSRSYTHIIRNILPDPSYAFDNIVEDKEILKRAKDVSKYYDDLHMMNIKRDLQTADYVERDHKIALYKAVMSVNALEAIRFYISFICSFSYAENDIMTGNASIISLIARDESLHHGGTNKIINLWRNGEDDPEMQQICIEYADVGSKIFHDVRDQEKEWGTYLFRNGSILGNNADMLGKYVDYVTAKSMKKIGIVPNFDVPSNPFPWSEKYFNASKVQTTPQEKEITSYISGGVDNTVDEDLFNSLSL